MPALGQSTKPDTLTASISRPQYRINRNLGAAFARPTRGSSRSKFALVADALGMAKDVAGIERRFDLLEPGRLGPQ